MAATVDDALLLLESGSFEVAMLDVNLGGQASCSVADALARRSISFVFSTCYGRIVSAFKRSSLIDANSIDVDVQGSTVKLSGRVRGWNERKVAERAAGRPVSPGR